MKSAGKLRSNCSRPRCGKPHCANGMHPESNQQSMTSGTRRIVPRGTFAQGNVTWSIHGLWTIRCSLRVGSMRLARRESVERSRISRFDLGDARRRVHVFGLPVADPDVERRSPVALARERPVDVVGEEVAEAAFFDVLGEPMDCAVVGDRAIDDRGRADVPGRARVLDERVVVRAPAERVVVAV